MDNGLNEINIDRVFLMMGSKCNFQCRYCIQHCVDKEENTHIDDKVYKYLNHLRDIRPNDYEKIMIVFFGGEPLMYIDVIKQVVNHYHHDFQYCVVTNGKLLTDELVDFFNEYDFQVNLSNDGINTNKTRNVNLLENEKFLKIYNRLNNRCIDSVVSAYNYDIQAIRNYIDDKCGNIYIAKEQLRVSWDMPKDLYDFDLADYEAKTRESANRAYNDILHGCMSDDVDYFFPVLNKIAKQLYYIDKTNCGQITNVMNIDLQGNIYVCHNSNIKIGTVDEKRYVILSRYKEWFKKQYPQKCLSCEYLPLCKGGCPLETHTKDNDKIMCKVNKIYFDIAIELADRLNNSFEKVNLEV